MSVLKMDREQSSMQFITTARELFAATMNYTSMLSNRRWRVFGDRVVSLAQEVLVEVGKSNGIFPRDEQSKAQRLYHLYEAAGSLNSLSLLLTVVYETIRSNPQGAFMNKNEKPLSADKSLEKLSKMSQNIGNLLTQESSLISGQIQKYSQQ